jgi:hypothetical protein
MAKLLSINKDKLQLYNMINTNDMICISIIGDARKGKSSLMNIISLYLSNYKDKPFTTSSSINHCTTGLDYVIINNNKNKYLLLDCQGLNYEKSSDDYKLLLFIYTISNIIIYNDKNIINNNVFTTLQPMALFLNNLIKKKDDVILHFRIADYEMEENENILLDKIFNLQNDQHDNVRKSLKLLFSEIKINVTHTLFNEQKNKLNENPKEFLLENSDFTQTIENILHTTKNMKPKNIDLQKLIFDINNNDNIIYEKLDIYTLNTQLEISKYIKLLETDTSLIEFNTDGYDKTRQQIDIYNKNIKKHLDNFNLLFVHVPNNLTNEYYNKIDILNKAYINMKNKNELIANSFIEPKYLNMIKNIEQIINEYISDYNNYDNISINYYYTKFLTNLHKKINIQIDFFVSEYIKRPYFIFTKNNKVAYKIKNINNNKYSYFITNTKTNKQLYDKNSVDIYMKKIKKYKKHINFIVLKIVSNNYKIIEKNTLKILNLDVIKYIKNNINNCSTLLNLYYGDYEDFLIMNNPYYKINLEKFISTIDGKTKHIKCNAFEIIKNKYTEKFNKNTKYKEIYYNKIKKIICNTYLYDNIPLHEDDYINYLKPNNIFFVKLKLSPLSIEKDKYYYIELTNFYNMLELFGIPKKVYEYYLTNFNNDNYMYIDFSFYSTLKIFNAQINENIIYILYKYFINLLNNNNKLNGIDFLNNYFTNIITNK